ncbi:MAG: YicC/YloC family endoribonuclease [Chromatocurvus sp.]
MANINSMTAFARGEDTGESGSIIVELRSVNHRYLDSHFKLPDALHALEPRLREALAKHLNRGKIDCFIRLQDESTETATLKLNDALLTRVLDASGLVAARLVNSAPVDPLAVLQYPGVVQTPTANSAAVTAGTLQAFDAALAALVATRTKEGEQLARLLRQRLDAILVETGRVRSQLPLLQTRLRKRLQQRLDTLDIEVDSGRLEQELVYLAQKSDVEEELDRLETHVDAVRQALEAGGPCGRRLDFLMQELNREANTLSSKSTDASLTASAVELKVLIEQMREQVQNIE